MYISVKKKKKPCENQKKVRVVVEPLKIRQMRGQIMDVHGAGAQRSDPKIGSARIGHGPQGDAQRVQNYGRLVRGGTAEKVDRKPDISADNYPEKLRVLTPKPTKPVMVGPMSKMGGGRMGGSRRSALPQIVSPPVRRG